MPYPHDIFPNIERMCGRITQFAVLVRGKSLARENMAGVMPKAKAMSCAGRRGGKRALRNGFNNKQWRMTKYGQ